MTNTTKEKLACSYFFATPAIAFGLLSARLPAIKTLVGADDTKMGYLLLSLGSFTLASLTLSGFLVDRAGARKIAAAGALILSLGVTAASLCLSFEQVALCLMFTGMGVGLCDVAMNALGIELERRRDTYALSFLHGISSLGGVFGSITGSIFAGLLLAPVSSFAWVLGCYLLIMPLAFKNIPEEPRRAPEKETVKWRRIPIFVFTCAILGLLCHIAEGSAGEWGSLLLHTVKKAPEEVAGLVFAAFTGATVVCRLAGDRLRKKVDDIKLLFFGSLMGGCGMAIALLAPLPLLGLCGFVLMGFGLGPITPMLFSVAGSAKNLSSGQASGVVSVFSYAGLLLLPPLLGFAAQKTGLASALWGVVICCLIMAAGSLLLKRQAKAE